MGFLDKLKGLFGGDAPDEAAGQPPPRSEGETAAPPAFGSDRPAQPPPPPSQPPGPPDQG